MSGKPFIAGSSLRTARHRLRQAVDVGLAGVIFVAPLFMGGRGPVGRLVFAAIVCFAALAWALKQCLESGARWVWSGAEPLILGGLAVAVLQLLPLPAWLLAKLSPTTLELLPLWTANADPAASLGTWNQISLCPVATREGLAMYLAYAMLFTVVVQRIESIEDVERILRWIALAAIGMAAIGLLQFLVGNGKFLWIYEHPSRDTYRMVKGTFANQNHFAHFLALGLGPLIWWLHLAGLTCLLIGVGPGLTWSVRALRSSRELDLSRRYMACGGVILAGLLASMAHSFGDFVWYIPACMSLTVLLLLLGCSCRLQQLSSAGRQRGGFAAPHSPPGQTAAACAPGGFARPVWHAGAVCTLGATVCMLHVLLGPARGAPHWNRYLKLSLAAPAALGDDAQSAERLVCMSRHVAATLRAHPDDPRTNLRMAGILLREFDLRPKRSDNPMNLSQVRDAALASHFASKQAQDAWLAIALGDNRQLLGRALSHSQRAVQLCPLQGEGYVYLAELSFLRGPQETAKQAYIAQAEEVRPFRGIVQFAVGTEHALAGNLAKAMEYWNRAFHQDPDVQAMIIQALGPQLPATGFLSEFRPDLTSLSRLCPSYLHLGRTEELRLLARCYLKTLTQQSDHAITPAQAAACWKEAATQPTVDLPFTDMRAKPTHGTAVSLPLDKVFVRLDSPPHSGCGISQRAKVLPHRIRTREPPSRTAGF